MFYSYHIVTGVNVFVHNVHVIGIIVKSEQHYL